MNILFLSIYGKNDTRTRAFIRILRQIGNLICVTKRIDEKTTDVDSPNDIEVNYNGIRDIGRFIKASYIAKNRFKQVDLLFLDNRMAAIPFFLFGKQCSYVVQDAREFYSFKETHHFVGKIGCILERRSLQKVDMVICANKQRAELMQKRFNLSKIPFVYENVFPSEYDEYYDENKVKQKYDDLFEPNKLTFISSSGCQIERTTDTLVLAVKKYEDKINLLLVGGSSKKDTETIKNIIKENNITNVSIISFVDTNTLKYLMSRSDVGVVIYGKHDDNNRYCASGKIYEYLNERLPMIASGNEPLVDFMVNTQTGIANDNYVEAIQMMLDHYPEYKDRANIFYDNFDPNEGNNKLKEEIIHRMANANICLSNVKKIGC